MRWAYVDHAGAPTDCVPFVQVFSHSQLFWKYLISERGKIAQFFTGSIIFKALECLQTVKGLGPKEGLKLKEFYYNYSTRIARTASSASNCWPIEDTMNKFKNRHIDLPPCMRFTAILQF